jgi:hypothetical protein
MAFGEVELLMVLHFHEYVNITEAFLIDDYLVRVLLNVIATTIDNIFFGTVRSRGEVGSAHISLEGLVVEVKVVLDSQDFVNVGFFLLFVIWQKKVSYELRGFFLGFEKTLFKDLSILDLV